MFLILYFFLLSLLSQGLERPVQTALNPFALSFAKIDFMNE